MDGIPKKLLIAGLISLSAFFLIIKFAMTGVSSHEALKGSFYLDQDEALSRNHVTIAHFHRTEDKIRVLRQGGPDRLQIIIDFDKTITKYKDSQGKPVKSTFDIFTSVSSVPQGYQQATSRLYSMYGPIESDPSIPVEDKLPFMESWVEEYEQILHGITLNQTLLDEAVISSNVPIREGCKEMLERLNEASVPVLVFSAGLGDVVRAVLRFKGLTLPNVRVVSNFFETDKSGAIIGFKGKFIHAFNKDATFIERSDYSYAKELKRRDSVVLVGDSLGDARMSNGLPHSHTVLKIAFLNSKLEENMGYFKESFDIVTFRDETMNVTNAVLQQVL